MKDAHPTALLLPMAVGVVVIICTILIHAVPLDATVRFVSREKRRHRVGISFWMDTGIVAGVILLALVAHFAEMALWAVLFLILGEFSDFGTAFYHSAVNYTSLGYGDIILSPAWKLLGPMETANGMLLFGVSTGLIFAVILWLVEARFTDLRE